MRVNDVLSRYETCRYQQEDPQGRSKPRTGQRKPISALLMDDVNLSERPASDAGEYDWLVPLIMVMPDDLVAEKAAIAFAGQPEDTESRISKLIAAVV